MPLLNESVRQVTLVGGGGVALEVYDYFRAEYQTERLQIDYVDDEPDRCRLRSCAGIAYRGPLSSLYDSATKPDSVEVAVGTPKIRQMIFERLSGTDGVLASYVHGAALESSFASIAEGVLIAPFTIVNRNAAMAAGSVANVHCSIGHGANVRRNTVLSPYCAVNGDASVGACCFLGTRASIYPGISVGDFCVVDSHCGVRASADDGNMISSRGNYVVSKMRRV